MGDHNVSTEHDAHQSQVFMKSLLADVAALEQMIETGRIETGGRRIGAEQEMFLLDRAMRPAPVALAVLKNAHDHRLTTEIGQFNLEANLSPRPPAGTCLRDMEQELSELVAIARRSAQECNADCAKLRCFRLARGWPGTLPFGSQNLGDRLHQLVGCIWFG